jgi:hypothetical protein
MGMAAARGTRSSLSSGGRFNRSFCRADRTPLAAALVNRRIRGVLCRVIDSAGQKLAYVYYEDEPGRRRASSLVSSLAAVLRRVPIREVRRPAGSAFLLYV